MNGPLAPFAPKNEKAEWRMIYDDLLEHVQPGDVITYAELDRTLRRAFTANRSPLYRAMREMGESRHRWLEAVPKVGYRVIEASEHVIVARRHKRRGQRQVSTALTVVGATDVARLDATQRNAFDQLAIILHAQHTMLMSHENRISRVEELLKKELRGYTRGKEWSDESVD